MMALAIDMKPREIWDYPPEGRKELLAEVLGKRTCFCICGLCFEFALDASYVRSCLDSMVEAGHLLERSLEDGEPVFVIAGMAPDAQEYQRICEDISYACGMTAMCFDGYRRGTRLADQEEVGPLARKTLRLVVSDLQRRGMVPDYFDTVRFNHTAIFLLLRDLRSELGLKDDAAVEQHVRQFAPEAMTRLLEEVQSGTEECLALAKSMNETLDEMHEEGEAFFREYHARIAAL